jgi:hypothetical protein
MFDTLVVTLPSAHLGGELRIRHVGREVTVDGSATEFSELSYVAFYADCEHEALPIRVGNRICLVARTREEDRTDETKCKDIGSLRLQCQRRRKAKPQEFFDRFSGVESSYLLGSSRREMIQDGDHGCAIPQRHHTEPPQ